MQRKLPLWLTKFYPGEPAHGALLRIAELNGFDTTLDVIEIIRGNLFSVFEKETTDAILQEVGEEYSDAVRQWTPYFEGRRYVHLNGERLSYKLHWVCGARRRCPRCLSESPHHRVWWDSPAITICPLHSVELEDTCPVPGCACKIQWTSGSITKCKYGHGLTDFCRVVPASELCAEAYIAGRLGQAEFEPLPLLDKAYLDDAIELMDKIGRAAIGGNRAAMPTITGLGVTNRQARLEGFKILKLGDKGFVEFLDSIAQISISNSVSRSLAPRYGWLFHWLSHCPRSPTHARLLELMAYHAKGHVPTKAPDDPFVTISDAAKQLNVHSSRLRRILKALGFIRPDCRRGVLLGIHREHVETVRALYHGSATLKATALRLGETQMTLIRLVKAGILPTAFRAGREGHAAHILKIADVDELIRRVTDGVPRVAAAPVGLVSLRTLGKTTSMGQLEIINLILKGKLRAAARLAGAPPLSGLYFNHKEARAAYLADTRTALTSKEAARELGISPEGIRTLLRGNYIQGEVRVESKRRFVAITRAELVRFKARYAAATEFSEILGTNARRASTRLIQLGLQPAISRKKCRKMFFCRDEVEALLSKSKVIPTSDDIRRSFWLGLHNASKNIKSVVRINAWDGTCNRIEFASGITHVRLAIFFSSETARIRVGIVIKNSAHRMLTRFLKSQIASISRDVGIVFKLVHRHTEPLILADCPRGKIFNQSTWPEIYRWVLNKFPKLLRAIKERLLGFRYCRQPAVSSNR